MPYKVAQHPNYIAVHFSGGLTVEQLLESYKDLARQPDFANQPVYVEYDETARLDASFETMGDYIAGVEQINLELGMKVNVGRKIALVTPKDLEFGIARMFSSMSSNRLASVHRSFRDAEDAMDWLLES